MPHVKREKNNIKFRFILTAFLLIAGVFVINNSSLAATGLQVGTGSLILGGAENLYYGNISASSATTSNLLLLQNGGVSKFTVDYYGNVTTPGTINGAFSGTLNAKNVSSGYFGSLTGGGDYYFPGKVGIGTTSPDQPLHVQGDVSLGRASASALTRYLGFTGATGNFSNVDAFSTVGLIINQAANGDTSLQLKNGTWGNNKINFTLDSSGRVGLGTTAPTAKIHVYDQWNSTDYRAVSGSGSSTIQLDRGNAASFAGMALSMNGTEKFDIGMAGDTTSNFYIGNGSFASKYLTIDTTGKIGIGTTGPNDIFSIGSSGGVAAPAGSSNTGHNNTATYLSTDSYALTNVGYVLSAIGTATSSLATSMSASDLWGGTKNGNIWNGAAGAGNVGIGTTNPGAYKLNVYGETQINGVGSAVPLYLTSNGANAYVSFMGSGTSYYYSVMAGAQGNDMALFSGGGQTMTLKSNGNVGIGTANPQYKLDVGPLAGSQTSTSGAGGLIRNNSAADASPYTQARIMVYGGSGVDGTNYAYLGYGNDAALRIVYRNTTQNYPMYIGSATAYDGTGTFSPEMTIKSGNVGIGTTNPGYTLDINGDINMPYGNIFRTGGTASFSGDSNSISFGSGSAARDVRFLNGLATPVMFIGKNGGSYSGNVGIGTTAPNDALSIGSGGVAAPAGSSATGHNNTATYLSTDNYALANYGLVKTLIAGGSGSAVGYWTQNGTSIYNNNSGSVGIGTAAPAALLHVSGGKMGIVSTSSGNGQFRVANTSDAEASMGFFTGLTESTLGNVTPTYSHGWIVGSGDWGIGTNKFGIGNLADGKPNFVIQEGGNVGIGTTNPLRKLVVQGPDDGTPQIRVQGTADQTSWWEFGRESASTGNFFISNTRLGSTATRLTIQDTNGNVGIGTTSPAGKLDIYGQTLIGTGNRTGQSTFPLYISDGSNLGWKVADAAGASKFELYTGNGGINQMRLLNGESIAGYAQDLTLGTDNNISSMTIQRTSGNVGIGTTAPNAPLTITSSGLVSGGRINFRSDRTDSNLYESSYALNMNSANGLNFDYDSNANGGGVFNVAESGVSRIYAQAGGNVGILTTGPNDTFSIGTGGVAAPAGSSATGHNNTATYLSTDNYALANVGYVKSAITAINSFLPLVGGTMLGDINLNNHNVSGINQLGVAKINATTIDPLYNINNINYATFASSISGGVKEEYVGKADIKRLNANHEYEYIINFALEDEGSDLWVWRKVIDYSNDNVQVFITPSGKFANVYYVIEGNKLIFRSDKAVEISYRLIGKRFDWKLWPTKAIDQTEKGYLVP